jgi:cell division protein FtsB
MGPTRSDHVVFRERTVQRAWRSLGSRKLLAINLAATALAAWGFSGEYLRNRDAEANVARLRSQTDEIRAMNEAGKRALAPSADEIEAEARVKLNMKRPGEEVVIVQGGPNHAVSEAPSVSDAVPASNPAKWWKLFFE